MPKLAKSLTIVAGGVPAAAIFTACAINASPKADGSTTASHAENVANVTSSAGTEAPGKSAAAPPAAVQPRSSAPPGDGTPATPHKDTGRHPRHVDRPNQPVPDPQGGQGGAAPAANFAISAPADTAVTANQDPADVPMSAATDRPDPATPPPGTIAPASAAFESPPSLTPGGQTAPSSPPKQGPTPADRTHPAPHKPRPHPAPVHRTAPPRHERATQPADAKQPTHAKQSADATRPAPHTPARSGGRTTPDATSATPDQAARRAARPESDANSNQVSTTTAADVKKKIAKKVVAYARAQLGKPYVFGAEGPRAFDCSGLVQAAYKSAGINLPRTSDVQYWFGKRVHAGQERPGDLVYFDYKPGHSGPGHVGIVLDPARGLMIVAPHTGDHVKIQSYKRYPGGPVGFTRPLDRPDMQHKLARMARQIDQNSSANKR